MTRLSSYRQKQYNRKVLLYVFILVALVIFMFTAGIRLLADASFKLGDIVGGDEKTEVKKDEFYGSLSIDSVPLATNSATIVVSGYATNYELVEFYINGDKVDQAKLDASTSFTKEVGDLTIGDNTVYLIAKTKKGDHKKKSEVFEITYKNKKPTLEISEPTSPTRVYNQEVKIAGKTDSEVFIRINSLPLVVNPDGSFQTSVQLRAGENTIEVVAEDDAGNIETKELKVTYEKD
jgi:hypothetical protein